MKEVLRIIISKSDFLKFIKLRVFRIVWRKENKHNYTKAINCFSRKRVSVGIGTYGDLCVRHFGNPQERLNIGSYCSIAPKVTFVLGGEHNYSSLTTYPIRQKLIDNENESETKGTIIVGDDVWIGYGVTVLSGVVIGQGAIIAAGSVVSKNVPPYAIYTTGKVIKYRFSSEIIEKLCEIDFKKLDYDAITQLYKKYNGFNNIDLDMVNNILKEISDLHDCSDVIS